MAEVSPLEDREAEGIHLLGANIEHVPHLVFVRFTDHTVTECVK